MKARTFSQTALLAPFLIVGLALAGLAEPSKPTGTRKTAATGQRSPSTTFPDAGQPTPDSPATISPDPAPFASSSTDIPGTPPKKPRSIPFKSKVTSVDKQAQTFKMGKRKIRLVHVVADSTLLTADGTGTTFSSLAAGVEVRGSLRKRPDGQFELIMVRIGIKPAPGAAAAATEGDALP